MTTPIYVWPDGHLYATDAGTSVPPPDGPVPWGDLTPDQRDVVRFIAGHVEAKLRRRHKLGKNGVRPSSNLDWQTKLVAEYAEDLVSRPQ